MHFYQLGKLLLNIPGERLRFPYDSEWSGKTQDYLWSPQRTWANTIYLPKPQAVTVRGYLTKENEPLLLQNYRRLVGLETDVIGYEFNACNEIEWYHNRGVLKEVSPTAEDPFSPAEVSLNIEFAPYWQPLDPILWGWGEGLYSDHQMVSAPSSYIPDAFPNAALLFGNVVCAKPFYKHPFSSYTFVYDPDYWTSWGQSTFVHASDWVTMGEWHTVAIDESKFGAPPHSMYAFKGLGTTGEITIHVIHTDGAWESVRDTITIDLAALHARMTAKGYTGLQNTDIVVIGDVKPKPGFVIRNNAILSGVFPTVSYPGFFPGMLAPGVNRIAIYGSGQSAWRHVFRRL